jgi:hypothetical protein
MALQLAEKEKQELIKGYEGKEREAAMQRQTAATSTRHSQHASSGVGGIYAAQRGVERVEELTDAQVRCHKPETAEPSTFVPEF